MIRELKGGMRDGGMEGRQKLHIYKPWPKASMQTKTIFPNRESHYATRRNWGAVQSLPKADPIEVYYVHHNHGVKESSGKDCLYECSYQVKEGQGGSALNWRKVAVARAIGLRAMEESFKLRKWLN